jgi:hypothetical protein
MLILGVRPEIQALAQGGLFELSQIEKYPEAIEKNPFGLSLQMTESLLVLIGVAFSIIIRGMSSRESTERSCQP